MAVEVDIWTFRTPVVDVDLTGFKVEAIESIDHDEGKLRVDRTKDEISAAPEFDPSGYADQEYRLSLARYYTDFYR